MNDSALPRVSIILPARNEAEFIRRTLRALEALDYPRDRYEIIVVDNGSTDATVEAATALGATVLMQPDVRVGELRNRGSQIATGEILAFLDADCLAPAGWLRSAVDALGDDSVGAVGGICTAPEEGTWVEGAWANRPPAAQQEVAALAASSLIIRTSLFNQLNGFDARLHAGEDDDLSRRVREAGYTLLTLPACVVVHLGYPASLFGVLRRQIWHGRSQLQVAHGKLDRLLLLTHLFCAFALLFVIVAITSWGGITAALLLLVGTIAMAAAAGLNRSHGGVLHTIQLMLIFWFFLLGRSIGLVLSYWDRSTQRRRSQSTTSAS